MSSGFKQAQFTALIFVIFVVFVVKILPFTGGMV